MERDRVANRHIATVSLNSALVCVSSWSPLSVSQSQPQALPDRKCRSFSSAPTSPSPPLHGVPSLGSSSVRSTLSPSMPRPCPSPPPPTGSGALVSVKQPPTWSTCSPALLVSRSRRSSSGELPVPCASLSPTSASRRLVFFPDDQEAYELF